MPLIFLTQQGLDSLVPAVNDDPEFKLVARAVSADVHLHADDHGCTFRIREGAIRSARIDPFLEPWSFAIRGTEAVWAKVLSPIPPPHHHHLYAAMFRRNLSIEGDLELAFAHLPVLSRLVELMRSQQNRNGGSHGRA